MYSPNIKTSYGRKHKNYNDPCHECGTFENLSRHHLKNRDGKRTGVITILCRPCHDLAEIEYQKQGIEGSLVFDELGEIHTFIDCKILKEL